jgi:hypothetical protein
MQPAGRRCVGSLKARAIFFSLLFPFPLLRQPLGKCRNKVSRHVRRSQTHSKELHELRSVLSAQDVISAQTVERSEELRVIQIVLHNQLEKILECQHCNYPALVIALSHVVSEQ